MRKINPRFEQETFNYYLLHIFDVVSHCDNIFNTLLFLSSISNITLPLSLYIPIPHDAKATVARQYVLTPDS
jgi:hypothetical protein